MAEQYGSKRLTHVDAVVVAAVCLLLILLVPVLFAKPRARAVRALCGANLAQIGKAMFVYAADYEGALPRAGGPTSIWGGPVRWDAFNRYQAYGLATDGRGGRATISSCFYLLVKYYEMPPRLFICRGDRGTSEFKLSDVVGAGATFGLADLWDYGPDSWKRCSYSYHMPFGVYALTTSRDPNLAVAADRNPFIESPTGDRAPLPDFLPDIPGYSGNATTARAGNAITHEHDGQSVLFLDGRVTFETRPYCGVGNDNIYLVSREIDRGSPVGDIPIPLLPPSNEKDSVLVLDPPAWLYEVARPNRP